MLLCEDTEHERFFRRLLKKWFGRGKLRVERIPNRQGAGDAFVLANYTREVRLARSKGKENYALVVAIDGDHFKVGGRMRQLEQKPWPVPTSSGRGPLARANTRSIDRVSDEGDLLGGACLRSTSQSTQGATIEVDHFLLRLPRGR